MENRLDQEEEKEDVEMGEGGNENEAQNGQAVDEDNTWRRKREKFYKENDEEEYFWSLEYY